LHQFTIKDDPDENQLQYLTHWDIPLLIPKSGELKEIIPTTPIQVDLQFCKIVPLFKAEHSEKLLERYRMRFGMGPILWAVLDLFRTTPFHKIGEKCSFGGNKSRPNYLSECDFHK